MICKHCKKEQYLTKEELLKEIIINVKSYSEGYITISFDISKELRLIDNYMDFDKKYKGYKELRVINANLSYIDGGYRHYTKDMSEKDFDIEKERKIIIKGINKNSNIIKKKQPKYYKLIHNREEVEVRKR